MNAWPFNSALARYIFKRLKSSRRRQPEPIADWAESWEPLLEKAGLLSAEARNEARDAAVALERSERLVCRSNADGKLRRVLVPRAAERAWFADANERHPAERQSGLAAATREAAQWPGIAEWKAWCERLAVEMEAGHFPDFVDRHEEESVWLRDLEVVNQLTSHPWPAGTLLRVASAEAAGDSKFLETRRSRLERMLKSLSDSRFQSLADLGLIEPPRRCLLHGPLRLRLHGHTFDFAAFKNPVALGEEDLLAADVVELPTSRVLSVENETTFHELARLASGELLIQTSYASSATLALLRRLPAECECTHFGDSDPAGFDILRDLRERSRRQFGSLQMGYRKGSSAPKLNHPDRRLIETLQKSSAITEAEHHELARMLTAGDKGRFEQESLPRPDAQWPFYPHPYSELRKEM